MRPAPTPIVVRLEPGMEEAALALAYSRSGHAMERGLADRAYAPTDRVANDLIGTRSEAAVAQHFEIDDWPRLGDELDARHVPDVGGVDVRATSWRNGGLIVYKWDPDLRPFVLVTVAEMLYIRGWVFGLDAKDASYWRPEFHQPCYLVPQPVLARPELLPIGASLPEWCR